MRDISALHPTLQTKVAELQAACKKKGIIIGISECVRTVAEQDALYAKGRTAAGSIVTNAKGSSYSSMHQWGVAFDFYLIMDVDGDGKTSDDAYNNASGLFDKVGKIGQELGLEWGGSWTSIKDRPHFQLPNWGSTATKLKSTYGTPEKFKATWTKTASKSSSSSSSSSSKTTSTSTSTKVTTYSKNLVEAASKKNSDFAGTYKTTSNLNLRLGAGKTKGIITTIPKGSEITCYGYYTPDSSKATWYYVAYGKYEGYVSAAYCQKKTK
jgi:hypothetical protein